MDVHNSDTSPAIRSTCTWEQNAPICGGEIYRTLDGTCNSPVEPIFGRAMTPLQRINEATYAPGSYGNPRMADNGLDLPSARLISTSG